MAEHSIAAVGTSEPLEKPGVPNVDESGETGKTRQRKQVEEEKDPIRDLLLFIQSHKAGQNRLLTKEEVNFVNHEMRSKHLRFPEIKSVSEPPRISPRAQPKTMQTNTRERQRTKITTRRRVSPSPVRELSEAELSRISDEKCRQELREERLQKKHTRVPPKPTYIGFKPPRDRAGYGMPDAPMSRPSIENF